jgi:hypothetical protein
MGVDVSTTMPRAAQALNRNPTQAYIKKHLRAVQPDPTIKKKKRSMDRLLVDDSTIPPHLRPIYASLVRHNEFGRPPRNVQNFHLL